MDDGCFPPGWVPVKPSRAEPSRGRTPRTVPEEQQDARVSSPAHSGNTRLGEFHSFWLTSMIVIFFCVFTIRSLFAAQINDP